MQNIKLTWTEAKEAMKEGRRVEHSYFCGGEWFEMRDGVILDELGSEGKLGRKRVGL